MAALAGGLAVLGQAEAATPDAPPGPATPRLLTDTPFQTADHDGARVVLAQALSPEEQAAPPRPEAPPPAPAMVGSSDPVAPLGPPEAAIAFVPLAEPAPLELAQLPRGTAVVEAEGAPPAPPSAAPPAPEPEPETPAEPAAEAPVPAPPAIPPLPPLPVIAPFVPPSWQPSSPVELIRPAEPGPQDYFGDERRHWITGNNVANRLAGGERNDTLEGEEANDTLWGGDGADSLMGGIGNDVLMGQGGYGDAIHGEAGDDLIFGNGGPVRWEWWSFGSGGNFGGAGADTIVGSGRHEGGDGDDVLLGGREMTGGKGDDLILGGWQVIGGDGDDVLLGGYEMTGGAGNDLLMGGAGATSFNLAWTSGQDTAAGYEAALDDLLLQGFSRVTVRVANATDAVITFEGDDAYPAARSVLLHGAVLPDGRLHLGDIKAPGATLVLDAPSGVVQPAGGFYEIASLILNGVVVTPESSGLNFGSTYGGVFTSSIKGYFYFDEIVRVILPDVELI